MSSRLACGHDIPVMIVNSRETQPSYFNPCDTMKLFAGNGQFTMDDDKYKVRDVLDQMLTAKANSEFDAGNLGLARGHVLLRSLFLAGLPGQGTAESQPDITDGASAVAGSRRSFAGATTPARRRGPRRPASRCSTWRPPSTITPPPRSCSPPKRTER